MNQESRIMNKFKLIKDFKYINTVYHSKVNKKRRVILLRIPKKKK